MIAREGYPVSRRPPLWNLCVSVSTLRRGRGPTTAVTPRCAPSQLLRRRYSVTRNTRRGLPPAPSPAAAYSSLPPPRLPRRFRGRIGLQRFGHRLSERLELFDLTAVESLSQLGHPVPLGFRSHESIRHTTGSDPTGNKYPVQNSQEHPSDSVSAHRGSFPKRHWQCAVATEWPMTTGASKERQPEPGYGPALLPSKRRLRFCGQWIDRSVHRDPGSHVEILTRHPIGAVRAKHENSVGDVIGRDELVHR